MKCSVLRKCQIQRSLLYQGVKLEIKSMFQFPHSTFAHNLVSGYSWLIRERYIMIFLNVYSRFAKYSKLLRTSCINYLKCKTRNSC